MELSGRLFRGARLFDGRVFRESCDLRVGKDGRIAAVGPGLPAEPGVEVTELDGRWLLPGVVDCHVHFREPGLERKEGYATGSAGALHGGVTTVLEIQNNPPLLTTRKLLDEKLALAGRKSRVDFGCYGNLVEEALPELRAIGARSPALKCFLGCSTGAAGVPDEATLRRLFRAAAEAGCMVVAHCEDDAVMRRNAERLAGTPEASRHERIRSVEAEVVSIRQAIGVALETGVRLHVFHISSAEGARLVAEAGEAGHPVSGSTGVQYLLLTAADAAAIGQNRLKVNPAVKSAEDRSGLQALLAAGRIACVGTDHAPHPLDEKDRPYAKAPSGFPSIDLFLPLMIAVHDRFGIPLERLLASITADPASEFGLERKGRLAAGCDADLLVVDAERVRTVDEARLPSKSRWSPFHGWELRGFPEQVWLRGALAAERGRAVGAPRGCSLW